MKRKFYTTLCLVFAFSLFSMAQEQITVESGDNLINIIAEAEDGATITIKSGKYIANFDEGGNANIVIESKSLTIIGESKYDKPVIYIRSIDVIGEVGNLTFENLEISGLPVDHDTMEEDPMAEGEEMVGSYFVNFTSDLVSIENLTIRNCEIRNLFRAVIRGDRAAHDVGTILVDNSIIHDIRNGSNYGVFRLQSNLTLNTFKLTNSTLYNVQVGIIQSENTPADFPKTVLVENCTFWNIGGATNSRYQFDFKSSTALNFEMRHNILGKTNEIGLEDDFDILGWRFNYDGATSTRMVANNIAPDFLVVPNSEVYQGSFDDINWSQSQFNVTLDPEFADPVNGDFTLNEDSDLMWASLEGEPIGDPRWDPLRTSARLIMTNKMAIYPNPASGNVNIQLERPGAITIYNALGSVVKTQKLNEKSNHVDISELRPGMYFVKNDMQTSKLIVR